MPAGWNDLPVPSRVEKTKKRVLAYHYSPNGRTFHVAARIRDEPGALSKVLEKLRERLDFITDLAFAAKEGAVFSGFAKPTSDSVTVDSIKASLKSLPVVIESEVSESREGLLVDTLHSGIEVGEDRPFALFPVVALSRTFGEIAALMGSGGETILFNEGMALGRVNTDAFASMLGPETMKKLLPYIAKIYNALGWGDATVGERREDGSFLISIEDCFECSSKGRARQGCSFVRGHLSSSFSAIHGGRYLAEETKCRFRGEKHCEFVLKAE